MEAMNSWGAPANVATAGAIEAKAIDASTTIAKADIAKRTGALCSLFVACVGVSYGFGFMLNQHALGFQSGNGCDHRCRGQKIHHQETVDPRLRCITLFRCGFCILRIFDSIISILQHWLAVRTIRESKFFFVTLDRRRSSVIVLHHLQAREFYEH